MMHNLESSTTSFKDYSPTSPNDGRRGACGQRRVEQRLREQAQAETAAAQDPFAAAGASLAAAEAQLPHYLATTDSEDSEDDKDYTPTILVHEQHTTTRLVHQGQEHLVTTLGPRHRLQLQWLRLQCQTR